MKYDETKIKEVLDRVRNEQREYTVLFDADNTLYRFSTYGRVDEALRDCYNKGFYKQLPVFPEAPIVVENLQRLGLRVGIATSILDTPFCEKEKLESFMYHFPTVDERDIYIIPPGKSKSEVVGDVYDKILIDDYHANIIDWYNAGGLAIKKTYSGKTRPVPQVMSLIELFPLLHELNVY